MLWEDSIGDKMEWFLQLEAEGISVARLDARPVLIGYSWIYEGFNELSTCRSIGMSIGPIPWTAVDRWAERYQLTPAEFEVFSRLIRALDVAYLKHQQEQAKTDGDNRKKSNSTRRRLGKG